MNKLFDGTPNVSVFDLPRPEMIDELRVRITKYAQNDSRHYEVDVEASVTAMTEAIDRHHDGKTKYINLELVLVDGRRRSVIMV